MSVNPFDPHGPFDAPDTHKYNPADLPPPLFCESDLQTHTRLKRFFAGQGGNPPGEREQHNKASYYWEDPSHTDLKYQLIKQNFDLTVICADPGPQRIGRY